jgi:hypothetical protein
MKQHQHITTNQTGTSASEVGRWATSLEASACTYCTPLCSPRTASSSLALPPRPAESAPSAKMAGNWLNTPEKLHPMACNACFPEPSGMWMGSVTTCARTCLSTSATRRRS